jgi:hypothetical protein
MEARCCQRVGEWRMQHSRAVSPFDGQLAEGAAAHGLRERGDGDP